MKYKAQQAKRNGMWYPQSVNSETISTKQICRDIAGASAITSGDVMNVLDQLKEQMLRYLANGNKVKLDGIGTFYLTAQSQGNGVATEEEVSASQIKKVMVRFQSEKQQSLGGVKKSIPALAASEIHWERVERNAKTTATGGAAATGSNPTGTGGTGTGNGNGGGNTTGNGTGSGSTDPDGDED